MKTIKILTRWQFIVLYALSAFMCRLARINIASGEWAVWLAVAWLIVFFAVCLILAIPMYLNMKERIELCGKD